MCVCVCVCVCVLEGTREMEKKGIKAKVKRKKGKKIGKKRKRKKGKKNTVSVIWSGKNKMQEQGEQKEAVGFSLFSIFDKSDEQEGGIVGVTGVGGYRNLFHHDPSLGTFRPFFLDKRNTERSLRVIFCREKENGKQKRQE